MTHSEPRNPLYLLLLLVGLLFTVTALAYAVVPVLEEKAAAAGQPVPPSELRALLRAHGGTWLLWELGALTILGIASMWVDHRRSLQKGNAIGTIPAADPQEFGFRPVRGTSHDDQQSSTSRS